MSMGAQPAGNTTTTTAPPAYMLPYISTALGQANNLAGYQPQYYPGNTVAGFSQPQEQAFGAIQNLAGSDPMGMASGYNNSLLNGNFTGSAQQLAQTGQGGATNPYLDRMYRQAADATRGQLESEFGGTGRNVDASQALRGEQLNNLATGLYGNAYTQDQNRALSANDALLGAQQGAVYNSQSLARSNLGLQDALAGVGSQVQNLGQQQINANQNLYNYYQQLPLQSLKNYEGMLGGVQPGSAQSSPYFTNPAANDMGMAMAMAQLFEMM